MKTVVALAALIAAITPLTATAQGRPPQPVTLVRAGNLFDAEAGRMVGPRDILIRGERVAEVGEGLAAPEAATVIDLSRCAVTPGLIDGHTHILAEQRFGEDLSETAARDNGLDGDAYRVLAGARRGRDYLDAGFTTIRDLGNSGRYLDLVLARGFQDGVADGPRIYGSGPGLSPSGGQLQPMPVDPHHLVDAEYRIVAGVDDGRLAVRQAIAAGARVIKIYPEASPQRTRMSVEEIRAIVAEARRHNTPVAAHATDDQAVRDAVEAGVTSIEHAYVVSDETLRLMGAKGVWYVPTEPSVEMAREFTTSWAQRPSDEQLNARLEEGRERIRHARALGVRIALGSDLYFPYGPGRGAGSRATLEGYVEAGMPAAEALQAATWEAGRMLGDDRLGVLRAGSYADLIAMPGDPTTSLEPLRSVRLVMKGGRVMRPDAAGACGG
jgi:imidazolonepropionase-like amidohydrolase